MADQHKQWLGILAGLVCPSLPGDAVTAMEPMLPHLRQEFEAKWLTAETARQVAETKRYGSVPSWDVIATALRAHIRAARPLHAPRLSAPREPDPEPPTPEELARIRMHVQQVKSIRAQAVFDASTKPLADVTLSGEALAAARATVKRRSVGA